MLRSSPAAEPPNRPLTRVEAANHALFRLAFGPQPRQLSEVARTGWKQWVEQQLHPETLDDAELEARLGRDCPSLGLSLSELQRLAKGEERARARIKDELRFAVLLRAVYSQRQFQEVIVEFWRNHFNVDVNKVPFLATHYEEHVLRKHAFGTFADLLMASAKHPAMLIYLDNYVSHRNGVNENYARELMELHTLGVDNGYAQADVEALARVLTGWTCGWHGAEGGSEEYGFYFNEDAHDTLPATVVGLPLEGGGLSDGEKAIQHLAHHDGTARFVSTKLCRYLVSDSPPDALIERVSEVFRSTNGDLRETYRAIILSPEFASSRSFRAKVKTPFEFTVSVLRATAAEIKSAEQLFRELQLMGQPIYECTEPTGYSDLQEAWLDPGVMVYRWNLAIKLVRNEIEGVSCGSGFVEPVLHSSPAERAKKVMELLLPGARDRNLERSLSLIADPRVMTAYALGSPGFQQQ
ncbi:MAG: DUF1800 domain-containing protein [Planctomycetes bacterium]|nr:DUF1800 domain-containing protein [Planctomycetota bacterium]